MNILLKNGTVVDYASNTNDNLDILIENDKIKKIEKNIDEYINKLDELKNDKFLCVVLFITDVYKNGSYVLYNREEEDIIKDAFDLKDVYEGVYIDNLVSRKKQMLPALLEVIDDSISNRGLFWNRKRYGKSFGR